MQKVVLDSDIIIDYLRTGQGILPKIVPLQSQGEIEIYISAVTIFELFVGSSSKRDELLILNLINSFKKVVFDQNLAQFAGEIRRDKKLSVALADFFIAASALFIDAQLATRNKKHYQGIKGLKFFTPSAFTPLN